MKKLIDYIESLQSQGKYTFTSDDIHGALERNDSAIKASLFRLVKKGRVAVVRKGFYVIIPLEYRIRGILPPILFTDDLMRYLGRTYYAGLLSAAALHGAAHQQPQDFFVITGLPPLRTVKAGGTKIRFFVRRNLYDSGIEEKRTDTGVIKVSSPELTAIDVVMFAKRIGGLNRAAEVLNEMADSISPPALADCARKACTQSILQRLGFLFENVIEHKVLAEALYDVLRERLFFPVYLAAAGKDSYCGTPNRWKVRVNALVEIEK
ncbi:MAG: type IV toxin-antitoxin system AbiEi family antitoxin [Chitinispirillaceae bacterium]|nr:type IV toxin-antitoxin system AbiEi family antitoxin [Chitinispirillaceae bacterium]